MLPAATAVTAHQQPQQQQQQQQQQQRGKMSALLEEPEDEMQQQNEETTTATSLPENNMKENDNFCLREDVSLSGGPPWGFVFEGGSEFQCPLIQPESVADRSGLLQVGDQILGVGPTATNDCHALTLELIRATPPGQALVLQLLKQRTKKSCPQNVTVKNETVVNNSADGNVTLSNISHASNIEELKQAPVDSNSNTLPPSPQPRPALDEPLPPALLTKSPSLTSLNSDTGSESSCASLPNNLLASSIPTLQRNCPVRRSEAMLSTLVRKFQDSLPRRNSERHHNHHHQQQAMSPPQQGPPEFYQNDQPPLHHQQQQQPKVKKPLVSSFSFSLGRAPRPLGHQSPPSNNDSQAAGPVIQNQQQPQVRSPLMSPDPTAAVPTNVYPNYEPSHRYFDGHAHHQQQPQFSSQLHLNSHGYPSAPHQTANQPPTLNHHPLNQRISASVINLPTATVSKSASYIGGSSTNHHNLQHHQPPTSWQPQQPHHPGPTTFAIENPLDGDVSPIHSHGPQQSSYGLPTRTSLQNHPHQFASCDQLNSNMLLQPALPSYHLSRGPKLATTTITECFSTGEEEQPVSFRHPHIKPSMAVSSWSSTSPPADSTASVTVNGSSYASNRLSWMAPANTSPTSQNFEQQPNRPQTLPVTEENSTAAQFGNYARCVPSNRRLPDNKSPPNQATIIRPQSNTIAKSGFANVIAGRPPTRVSPQYGSNHQLYYRDSMVLSTSSSPPAQQQQQNDPQIVPPNYHLSSRSSPSIGLLDMQQQQQQRTKAWSAELPSASSSSTTSSCTGDAPPQLPPRRYALEEIRGYIASISPPPSQDPSIRASNVDDTDYADQLRVHSRSLIAATGKPPVEKQSAPAPAAAKPFFRDQAVRQVALIAPLLANSHQNFETHQNNSVQIATESNCSSGKITPRKVVEQHSRSSTEIGDESIVSVQLPPPSEGSGTISRIYRRLLVRANSDCASNSIRASPPSTPTDAKENTSSSSSTTLGSNPRRPSPSGQPQIAKSNSSVIPSTPTPADVASSHSFFCDVDALASNASKSASSETLPPPSSSSPIITTIIDGCIMEPIITDGDGDSAFAELSPGASHSSTASSTSGRRGGNASARSTGTNSLNSASCGPVSSAAVSVVTSTNGSKTSDVAISLFTRQRALLEDEIRCDTVVRTLIREIRSNTEADLSILQMGSSSVGQYLYQVAAVNSSSMNSPPLRSSEASSEVLTDEDSNGSETSDLREMVTSARLALTRKSASLKAEQLRIEAELSALKTQRRVLIDQQLANQLRDIDDEALDRLRARLDELEMGALLAVRVASRAARLSPATNNSKTASREWRIAVEKLDDVRDVIDSLRQRIAGALSSKMLLTAISDQDLAEVASFINRFGQLLFEYHELIELNVIADQQLETFNSLHQSIVASMPPPPPQHSGSVTVVVD